MNMKFSMLAYLIGKKWEINEEELSIESSDLVKEINIDVKGIRIYREDKEFETGKAYILMKDNYNDNTFKEKISIFDKIDTIEKKNKEKRLNSCHINKEKPPNIIYFIIFEKNSEFIRMVKGKYPYLAIKSNNTAESEIFEYLYESIETLNNFVIKIDEYNENTINDRDILKSGEDFLGHPYAVIDRDMRIMYASEGYISKTGEDGDTLSADVVSNLLFDKQYHNVARLREGFYYYESMHESNFFCRNLFFGEEEYYARIVMLLWEEKRIHKGEEDLFELFSDYIEKYLTGSEKIRKNEYMQPLRGLINSLSKGDFGEGEYIYTILDRYGWRRNHTYSIVKLQFLGSDRWDTHIETTLPFIVRELENEWKGSCAVIKGSEIIWIFNMSLSKEDTDQHSFHQRVAYFVRDHVCVAGVSSRFDDILLVPNALRTAEAALKIGRIKDPHFWYFLYEDYRLDYMISQVSTELPEAMLIHPAIITLIQYDEKNDAELVNTLKTFLFTGLNMTTAADKLYIHRTTFCRRMDRIKKITGLDISDMNTVLGLMISFKIMGN